MKRVANLTTESKAWLTSVVVHLVITIVLGLTSVVLPKGVAELSLALERIVLPEDDILADAFISSDSTPVEIGALSQLAADSALASAMELDETSLVVFEHQPVLDFGDRQSVDVAVPEFRGPELTERLPVQGAGSVGTTGAMGAIDRITQEILTSVEQQPTLVVWLFDESGSLKGERAAILKRFRRVYEELGVIEASSNSAFRKYDEKPLLTVVAGFGEEVTLYTRRPTDSMEQIESAVRSIGDSTSRYEFVFRAIGEVAKKFRAYRVNSKKSRNVLIVVFSDESGDDSERHEVTVELCQQLNIPVYVVGRPAPFGRETAYVKWIDPDPRYDQRPQWVPVTAGPETLMPEVLKLPFIGSGGREELIDSGFGPYALTKLCHATGGLYFAVHPNRVVGRHVRGFETDNLTAHMAAFFDLEVMKEYQPDYFSEREYRRQLETNRAKAALVEAAQIVWADLSESFKTRFAYGDEASLAADLSRAQRAAAIRQPELDRLCEILLQGEEDRPQLRSPRWRAGYDLALGRALAAKVRNEGYNMALAQAKQGMAFTNEANNTWELRSDHTIANSSIENSANRAGELLNQVVAEHPGTPWAFIANRELATPLGWRWEETYTTIPRPVEREGNDLPPQLETPREPPPRRNPPPL